MRALTLLLSLTLIPQAYAGEAKALFAGGCFWCMESDYEEREGVIDVVSGFTGGTLQNPTYRGDHEGHYEAVLITYNPSKIDYQRLLDHIKPDVVHIMADGRIVKSGGPDLALEVENNGYAGILSEVA